MGVLKSGRLFRTAPHDKLHALDSIAEITGVKEGHGLQVSVGWTLDDIRQLLERRDRNLRDLKDFTPRALPPPDVGPASPPSDAGPASPSGVEPTSLPEVVTRRDSLL